MIALIQKVKNAKVLVNKKIKSEINEGLLIFLGIHKDDVEDDTDYIIKKILNLRIFHKESNKFDLPVIDSNLHLLIVSSFTLNAKTRIGNRPDFKNAMNPLDARNIYDIFIKKITLSHDNVSTGEFGSNMHVEIINDGPINIIIDSFDRNKPRNNF